MKRSKIIYLIAAGAIALAAFGIYTVSQNKITNHPNTGTEVVAFGDSLVYGVGSKDGGGFVRILSKELGVPIINLGISGDTTKDALERVSPVAAREPKVVIVLLGGNDFLRGVPQEETFGNLRKIIQSIQDSGAAVILIGLESGLLGSGHRKLFDDLAEEYDTAYVPDILEGISGNRNLMSDSLHPNDQGYRLMAERIKPVLENLLD